MQRTLDLLEELRDVVQVQPRPEAPEVPRGNREGFTRGGRGRAGQAAPKHVVDDIAKRPAGPA